MKFIDSHSKGFTLIEVMIVIVLIGILSATALPKFSNLTVQARNSANDGVAAAFSSAVNQVHSGWVALNSPSTVPLITGGVTNNIPVNSSGWPDAGSDDECASLFSTLIGASSGVVATAGTGCTGSIGVPCYNATAGANSCLFIYGVPGGTTPPQFTYTTTSGGITIKDGS